MKQLPFILFVLAAAGCTGSSLQWVKEGAGPEDFRRDQQACLDRAGNFSFLSPRRDEDSIQDRPIDRSQGSLYRSCLEGMGYRQMRVESGKMS